MQSASILINLIAAVGLIGVWASLRRLNTPGAIEHRLLWLVGAAAILFIVRATYWGTGLKVLESLALIPAAILPLLGLIVTEGVLRRHAPFPVKVIAVGGGGLIILAALIGHRGMEPYFSFVLATMQFSLIGFCLCWLLMRNRRHHADGENQTADIFAVVLALAGALFVTDYPNIIQAPAMLGALGFLMAAYVLEGAIAPGFSPHKLRTEAAVIFVVITVFVLLAVNMLQAEAWQAVARLAFVLLTLFLTAIILLRYFTMRDHAGVAFQEYLSHARTDSLDHFLEDALSPRMMREAQLLSGRDLGEYDMKLIAKAFTRTPVFCMNTVCQEEVKATDEEACEQLEDLLVKNNASHIVMVTDAPPTLVFVSAPAFGDDSNFKAYLTLMRNIALLITHKKQNEARP